MRNRFKHRVCSHLGWTCLILSAMGCGGALRSAAYEHSQATLAVASTLKRAVSMVRCEQNRDDAVASCKASLQVIALQADALEQSAARLQSANGASKE